IGRNKRILALLECPQRFSLPVYSAPGKQEGNCCRKLQNYFHDAARTTLGPNSLTNVWIFRRIVRNGVLLKKMDGTPSIFFIPYSWVTANNQQSTCLHRSSRRCSANYP